MRWSPRARPRPFAPPMPARQSTTNTCSSIRNIRRRRRSRACALTCERLPPASRMRARRTRAVTGALSPGRRAHLRAGLALATLFVVPAAFGQDAAQWLQRAATAARTLNYSGTIAYQHAGRIETSRLVHFSDAGNEFEKLTNLDGPSREVIRQNDQVRC